MKKALIAMSGGVDSSVSALLMIQQGYDCTGITFKMFNKMDPLFNFDCIIDFDKDINDAKNVCDKLGIPFVAVDASDRFRKFVINNFIKTYEKGGTPNPCVECNRHIKFTLLYEYAKENGFDVIVTGHYAEIGYENNRYYIKKSDDIKKDQSYVLYPLSQSQLKMVRFPLSQISKEKARELASENGLITAHKSDSQDICFIPDGDYSGFIRRATGKKYPKGKFIDVNGNVLGSHNGIINYTIGQRKGLGIALGAPAYVKSKDLKTNTVVLASNDELFENEVIIENFNFMAVTSFDNTRCIAKIRYAHQGADCTAIQLDANTVKIVFDSPQRAPAKGQSAVLYDDDKVLGGGIIK